MATAIEIRCVNKSDSLNPHDRIINVGGVNADHTRWKLSQTEAIHCIIDDTIYSMSNAVVRSFM